MRFRPEHYFQTAIERIEQARLLYHQGSSYALTMYVSGVAVECLLRASKMRRAPEFDERHDLLRLFKASGLLDLDAVDLEAKGLTRAEGEAVVKGLKAAVSDVYLL